MTKPLLPDELWAIVEPLLPHAPPKPKGGHPRIPDRATLTDIISVLKSGIPSSSCWVSLHPSWSFLEFDLECRYRDGHRKTPDE